MLLLRTAVIANFFQASCEEACVTVCASVIMVRENLYGGSGESVVGYFRMTFLKVPKRAVGLVENGWTLERRAACSALRGRAGLKARESPGDNMVVYVEEQQV